MPKKLSCRNQLYSKVVKDFFIKITSDKEYPIPAGKYSTGTKFGQSNGLKILI